MVRGTMPKFKVELEAWLPEDSTRERVETLVRHLEGHMKAITAYTAAYRIRGGEIKARGLVQAVETRLVNPHGKPLAH